MKQPRHHLLIVFILHIIYCQHQIISSNNDKRILSLQTNNFSSSLTSTSIDNQISIANIVTDLVNNTTKTETLTRTNISNKQAPIEIRVQINKSKLVSQQLRAHQIRQQYTSSAIGAIISNQRILQRQLKKLKKQQTKLNQELKLSSINSSVLTIKKKIKDNLNHQKIIKKQIQNFVSQQKLLKDLQSILQEEEKLLYQGQAQIKKQNKQNSNLTVAKKN